MLIKGENQTKINSPKIQHIQICCLMLELYFQVKSFQDDRQHFQLWHNKASLESALSHLYPMMMMIKRNNDLEWNMHVYQRGKYNFSFPCMNNIQKEICICACESWFIIYGLAARKKNHLPVVAFISLPIWYSDGFNSMCVVPHKKEIKIIFHRFQFSRMG